MSGQSNMEGYGLGITSCDRVTSTEVCHNETHIPEWHPLYIKDQCLRRLQGREVPLLRPRQLHTYRSGGEW